ncbi:MAG: alpha/beta hydrolase [Oceanospirillaceae bacterium]|nr:alpha/beta hydrolase [Oceanospirillaceae bacterium]MBL34822.1 alpha/beta hydrolase [Oceanospirillaceae bacterium]MBS53442.1 alpha/beta hydrolase [Oceanospirillaceae bacterium]|tara:strand:- start:894 stop:1703 length:810 start_codon:yes stop_codon:yes gene_type:complete
MEPVRHYNNMSDILHFSHANGFPGGSYRQMLGILAEHYDVRVTDRLAHNPLYPVTNNWDQLCNELIHFFEQEYQQPVIAVGHSLGGLLSLMVAVRRPDLIKALVMLDAPALTRLQAGGLKMAKKLGLVDRITPGGRSNGRRAQWSSREEALSYFSAKTLMRGFGPGCLEDYVDAGTEPCGDGVRLRFDPETELSIYRTIPDNIRAKRPLLMPGCVVGGRASKVFKPVNAELMRRRLGMSVRWLPGSHMFPLEHPGKTAEIIHHWLEQAL